MTTSQSLIEAAYARSTSNDAGKLAIDGELLSHLNRKYQSMHARMAVAQKDNALARSTLTFAGAPIAATLPTDIIDIVRLETATGGRVYQMSVAEKDRTYILGPAVFRQGNSMISRGLAAGATVNGVADPIVGTVLTIFYTDAPASIVALSSTLDPRFPVRYENVLVLDLAIYLSLKDAGRDPQSFQNLKTEYAEENAIFLALTKSSNTAKDAPSTSTAPSAAGS
jgi:hypothetical protein